MTPLLSCLRSLIPDISAAACDLDAVVSAHLEGRFAGADELIRLTNLPAIRKWTTSLWDKQSPYVIGRAYEGVFHETLATSAARLSEPYKPSSPKFNEGASNQSH